jgi:hypothetical protein
MTPSEYDVIFAEAYRIRNDDGAAEMKRTGERHPGSSNQHTPKVEKYQNGIPQKTLGDLGITKTESSQWQKLAAIPTVGRPKKGSQKIDYVPSQNEGKAAAEAAAITGTNLLTIIGMVAVWWWLR